MLKLDNTLLDELGLGSLPEDQKRAMLQHIYETLELRVGTNLANQMSDQQLEEFEKFIDDGGDANQAQALQWLEANLPNYKQVVNEVFEALKLEVKAMAPQLVVASGAAPMSAVPAPPVAGFGPQQQQPAPVSYAQQPAPAPMNYAQPADIDMTSAPDPFAPPAVPTATSADFGAPAAPGGFVPQAPNPAAQSFGQPGQQPAPVQPFAPAPDPQQMPPQGQSPMYPQPQQDQDAQSQDAQNDSQQQPPATPQPPQQTPNGYQYPQQQPPAGPGYPPQHPPVQ